MMTNDNDRDNDRDQDEWPNAPPAHRLPVSHNSIVRQTNVLLGLAMALSALRRTKPQGP